MSAPEALKAAETKAGAEHGIGEAEVGPAGPVGMIVLPWMGSGEVGAGRGLPALPKNGPHPICRAFGRLMLELRLQLQLPLWQLARRTEGISDEWMRMVEIGQCVPTMDRAARHCAAFGLHLDEALVGARRQFMG